nr:10976_t:CDS:2 [Entrophospora candida]
MIKRNFQTLIFKKKKSSLIIIPTIKTLPTTNISSQNRKYGAQKSSKKTDTDKKSSSSSNTKTTSSGAGGSMIPGSQQFHITDKRYEVIKQILYETEKPDLSSLTQEDLERHETIERAWKLFCRHQKEQKELELARKYQMLNEANIELEKVDERLFKEAQLNNSKILFPGKMKIPTETPPLDGWNYNYTKPITTTIENISISSYGGDRLGSVNSQRRDWRSGHKLVDNLIQGIRLDFPFPSHHLSWIPFDEFVGLKFVSRGGFSAVYESKWTNTDQTVALKCLDGSQDFSTDFLDEIKSHWGLFSQPQFLHCHGITQLPNSREFMMVMQYAPFGDLRSHLQKNQAIYYSRLLEFPELKDTKPQHQPLRQSFLEVLNLDRPLSSVYSFTSTQIDNNKDDIRSKLDSLNNKRTSVTSPDDLAALQTFWTMDGHNSKNQREPISNSS